MNEIEITSEAERIQELKDTYCDCYKDVHGIKARWVYAEDLTVAELERMLDRLHEEYEVVSKEEELREQAAAKAARERIQKLLEAGAQDVKQAVKWLHEAERTDGDNNFLDYELGTPYGFVAGLLKNGL